MQSGIVNNSKTTTAASAAAIENSAHREVSVFGYYKGHLIEGIRAGHPQAQNVEIDGKPVGYVIFPTSVIATGRRIIDARQALTAAWIQTPTACYLVGAAKGGAQ